MRQKWLDILQLPSCCKTKQAYICSDHFSNDSFFELNEEKCRKRLLFDALPCEMSLNISNEEACSVSTPEQSTIGLVEESVPIINVVSQRTPIINVVSECTSNLTDENVESEYSKDDQIDVCNSKKRYQYLF